MQLTDKQLERLKKRLRRHKNELEHRLARGDRHGTGTSMRDSLQELSLYDNHPADSGTELFERGKDLALEAQLGQRLEEVRIALANMETGQYGRCSVCGGPIPFGRLEAIPWTAYCVSHVPERQLSESRPVEEPSLAPPFGRTGLDERDDRNGFDGEDAWQAVERYGNSDSPAMAEDRETLFYNNLFIESDENESYVEPIENFLATDLYGQTRMVVRGAEYRKYLERDEGDHGLEVTDAADTEPDG